MGLLFAAGAGIVTALKERRPKVKEGMRVLLLGDSLAVGLSPHLKALAKDAGVELRALAKTGTRIDQWAKSEELAAVLRDYSPELVLVSLGTNDAAIGAGAAERQKPYLDQLLEQFAHGVSHRNDYGLGADVVWIGPPTLPFESAAMTSMIRAGVEAYGDSLGGHPRGAYFPSETLEIPRAPDHIHPTATGAAGWAGALWSWLTS